MAWDPVTGEWIPDPPETPVDVPLARPSEMMLPAGPAFDPGGYNTNPNRPLMGFYSNVAPPRVENTFAPDGGRYSRFTDPLSGREYSKWPTDTGWVASPNGGYADMGDPGAATGLADWLARTMARAAPGSQERNDLLQFYQARDPMAFTGGTFQTEHVPLPPAPPAPAAPEAPRRDLRGAFGKVEAPSPDFFQGPPGESRRDTGPARVAPVGTERVPRSENVRPAQEQPDTGMLQQIADAHNEDVVTRAVTGQARPVGYTEPDDSGQRYAIVGELRGPTGAAGAKLVNANGVLLVYDPVRGYVSLTDPEYRRYLVRLGGRGFTRYQGTPVR